MKDLPQPMMEQNKAFESGTQCARVTWEDSSSSKKKFLKDIWEKEEEKRRRRINEGKRRERER